MSISQEIQKKKKSKIILRVIYTLILIILIIILVYFVTKSKQEDIVKKEFYVVGTGSLELKISADGKIISGKKVELNFPISGRIKEILKKEGDNVLLDEKIATLENNIYKLNLDKAKILLKNSYAILDEKREVKGLNTYEKDLLIANSTLDNTIARSRNEYDIIKSNFDLLMITKDNLDKDLIIEKSNLELIKQDENKKISNLENIVLIKSNLLLGEIEKYLGEIDEFMGITKLNKDKNDDYENLIGARNISIKKETENLFKDINNSFNIENTSSVYDYFVKTKKLLQSVISVLENTIDSVNLTNEEITSKKQQIRSYLNSLEVYYGDYIISKQSLDYEKTNKAILIKRQNNLITSLIGDIELIKKDIEYSSNNLKSTKDLIIKTIELAEKQKDKEISEYKDNTLGLSDKELKPYYIAIDEAKNNVAIAEENFGDTVLFSPVEGTILDLNYRAGEYFTRGDRSFGVIITTSGQYIESYIEQRDISSIFEGQLVDISLEAFDDYSFTGEVVYVSNKGEIDKNDITVYKTLISISPDLKGIKDSMSVNLEFIKDSVENDIVILSDYVFYEDGISKVKLLNGLEVEVSEGISDGEFVNIIDGLKVGDKIILK